MKAYRILWLFVCSVLGAVGAGVAFAWSIPVMLAIFGCAAVGGVVAAQVRAEYAPGPDHATSPGEARRLMSTYALVAGSAAVAVVGTGGLLGAWVTVPLVAVIVGGSPNAIRLYGRWLRLHAPAAASPRTGRRNGHEYSSEPQLENPTAGPAPAVMPRVAPQLLNDDELCLAWRASFSALQKASSRSEQLSVVEARREYIDEFERRNRPGLAAWLASGARAAGDPSRFVVGGSGAGHSAIDWDGLIHGPDR